MEEAQRRTDDDGGCLRNFANLFILLHDFLNTRLQRNRKEVIIGKDAMTITGKRTTGNFVVLFLFFMMAV
jgi:hypothetical protein